MFSNNYIGLCNISCFKKCELSFITITAYGTRQEKVNCIDGIHAYYVCACMSSYDLSMGVESIHYSSLMFIATGILIIK